MSRQHGIQRRSTSDRGQGTYMTTRNDIIAYLDQEVIKQERLLGLTRAYRRAVLARVNTIDQCRAMADAKVALLHPSDPPEAKEEVRKIKVGPLEVEFK